MRLFNEKSPTDIVQKRVKSINVVFSNMRSLQWHSLQTFMVCVTLVQVVFLLLGFDRVVALIPVALSKLDGAISYVAPLEGVIAWKLYNKKRKETASTLI